MESEVIKVAKSAIYDAIKNELIGYDKPLSNFVTEVLNVHKQEFVSLIDNEVAELLNTEDFKLAIKEALHMKLAKILINRIGGEIEKRVNELKQNPETRAKITLAITKIMEDLS